MFTRILGVTGALKRFKCFSDMFKTLLDLGLG